MTFSTDVMKTLKNALFVADDTMNFLSALDSRFSSMLVASRISHRDPRSAISYLSLLVRILCLVWYSYRP